MEKQDTIRVSLSDLSGIGKNINKQRERIGDLEKQLEISKEAEKEAVKRYEHAVTVGNSHKAAYERSEKLRKSGFDAISNMATEVHSILCDAIKPLNPRTKLYKQIQSAGEKVHGIQHGCY